MAGVNIDDLTLSAASIEDADLLEMLRDSDGKNVKLSGTVFKAAIATEALPVPVGGVVPYTGSTLPSAAFQFARGGSLVRANYPALRDIYITDVGTVTVTIATPGVFTLVAHGLATGSQVSLKTTGALPTGLSINTNYWVIYVTADTFRLATSEANATAGTAIATSGSQSGTHTLVSNPYGIDGADNFFLPDFRGVSLKGFGNATINARTKTGPGALGVRQEDQGQGVVYYTAVLSNFSSRYGDVTGESSAPVGQFAAAPNQTLAGKTSAAKADGTNGTPRTGTTTRDSSMGINFIVRVL
jgi:hypothetical protein